MTYREPQVKLELQHNASAIRAAFEEKFLLSWERFQTERKEWLEFVSSRGWNFCYETALLWDRMPTYTTVSFEKALAFLRQVKTPVLLMSEGPAYPSHCNIYLEGKPCKAVVVEAEPVALADRIAYEWYANFLLNVKNMYLGTAVLPWDIYVFDEAMEHLLVFTHEHDDWDPELDDPVGAANTRFCLAWGFPEECTP